MSQDSYVENVFLDFFRNSGYVIFDNPEDYRVLEGFYSKISNDEPLTQNQGNYLLRLMSKYKSSAGPLSDRISESIKNPIWKTAFRIVDYSKRVFIETGEDGLYYICLKFPFSLRTVFEKEFETSGPTRSHWDHDKKIRKMNLYDCNLLQLNEFVKNNGFEIDESFNAAVAQIEEIWNEQDSIAPIVSVDRGEISLVNVCDDVVNYWDQHKTTNLEKNLFLAKTMGFSVRFSYTPNTVLEKISSSNSSTFWFKDLSKFFDLCRKIDGTVCILLDRNTQDTVRWLENFVRNSDDFGISRKEIKVCFRESDSKNSKLNQWIKDNCVGGAVKDGKILIFQHKPPKWLFKDDIDVKIIATNSFTPATDPLSAAWISGHYCVCYLGDIKPTRVKDKKIVEL